VTHFCFGQIEINGRVLSKDSKEPIAYANIGILKSDVGTISNPDGSFSIRIPQRLINDTLFFSALGFGKKVVPIQLLYKRPNQIIYLWEKAVMLNEVSIREKKTANRFFKLGNSSVKGGVMECDTLYAGRSVSLLIENNKPKMNLQFPVYVEKASLRVYRNNLKSFKFRVRFNEVDITGQPGEDMLQQSIVVTSSMRNGWLEFDLSQLNFIVSKSFFVTFEQITDRADRIAIADGYRKFLKEHPDKVKIDTIIFEGKKEVRQRFKGSGIDLPGTFIAIAHLSARYTSYVRETSFGKWNKVRGIVTATVSVSDQPSLGKQVRKTICTDSSPECKSETIVKDFINDTGLNGAQLCVSVGGKLKFSKTVGYADIENRILVTDSTRFRINSISKSFTGVALARLVSENKIELDAPIQKYVPQFPEKSYPITARQLAGHLSGFRDYRDLHDLVHQEHYENAIQALKVFENDTLLFKPGARFYYSPFGFNLIGAAIENVSKMSYLEYIMENVFKPYNLQNTCGDDVNNKIPNRTKFYDAAGQENDFGDLSYKYPAGGLLSTATDLVKFGNELLNRKAMHRLLFTSLQTNDGKETGYGLGWYVGKDRNGHRIWYHSGDGFSSSSHLYIYPDDGLVIAFLGNGQEGAAFDIQKIAELYYKKK
jgi:CubicO group peptidase (beta-lactamase class C family)